MNRREDITQAVWLSELRIHRTNRPQLDYCIRYKPGYNHSNADGLSRNECEHNSSSAPTNCLTSLSDPTSLPDVSSRSCFVVYEVPSVLREALSQDHSVVNTCETTPMSYNFLSTTEHQTAVAHSQRNHQLWAPLCHLLEHGFCLPSTPVHIRRWLNRNCSHFLLDPHSGLLLLRTTSPAASHKIVLPDKDARLMFENFHATNHLGL